MQTQSELNADIKRYRSIMVAGFILVLIWGFFFEKYLGLKVPYYTLISVEICISALISYIPRLTKMTDLIFTINCFIALAHQGYLVVINESQQYFVISSSLALLIAIFPLKKIAYIRFIFISAFLFSLIMMIIKFSTTSLFYFVTTVSFSIVIYIITIERNKLLDKIKSDFMIIETERQKAINTSKMAALGEMSSGIAHEINNPLAILQGNISLLKKDLQLNPEYLIKFDRKVKTMESTVLRISKIIKGLKAFSRDISIEESSVENFSALQLLEDTLAFCQTRFINNKVELIYDTQEWAILVRGHSIQLSQVLLNLLNNSFDAIEKQNEKIIRLSIQKKENMIRLSISDNGPGVPKELRDKIMQPFFTTKEVGKGTGLGLSISQGIMKKHGGDLELVESFSGADFVMILPSN